MLFTLRLLLGVPLLLIAAEAASQSAPLPSPVASPASSPASWTCQGQVLDVSRRPVMGASVWAKGTRAAATTNSEGVFLLELPPGSHLLLVDYPGHLARDTQVSPLDSACTILVYTTRTRAPQR